MFLVVFGRFCNEAQNVSTFERMIVVVESLANGPKQNHVESWTGL